MSIKTVGIIGAGAVGSYVIWGLSKVEDITLGVIAKGERNQKLKADGCKINVMYTVQKYGHRTKQKVLTCLLYH